jgi:hypothetical protein
LEEEFFMLKQTLKYLAITSLCCAVACPALAQGKLPVSMQRRHSPSPASGQVQNAQPESATYTYTIFDFPGTLYTFPDALNIGAAGKIEIVGGYGDAPNFGYDSYRMYVSESRGVITETYQTTNFPGAQEQGAWGVNDAGQIVGNYVDSSGVLHGWELSDGTFTTINVPFSGAVGTDAFGINDSGEIVGCWASDFGTYGFTLVNGTYTSFSYPESGATCAFSVNNKGDIAGYWDDANGVEHGFILTDGIYISVDPPGSTFTDVAGINDSGEVVGAYCTTSDCALNLVGSQGFLLSNGTYTTFTISGATETFLSGINDKGLLLGGYDDVAGYEHGFIATP